MTPFDLDAFWATFATTWQGPGIDLLPDDDREHMAEDDEPLSVAEERTRDDWAERQMEAMWP